MSQKRRWDNQALLDYARKEGEEKGRKQAEKEKKVLEEKFIKAQQEAEEARKEAEEAKQKSSEIIADLIRQSDMDDQTIAGIAKVSLDFVRTMRVELSKEHK